MCKFNVCVRIVLGAENKSPSPDIQSVIYITGSDEKTSPKLPELAEVCLLFLLAILINSPVF